MKKLMRWTGILIGGLVGLMVLGCLGLYVAGVGMLGKTYPDIPVETVRIPSDAEAVARGKHVAEVWSCENCHGDNLGGSPSNSLNDETTLLGSVPAPNLTAGSGGIGKTYSDADWVRAIRHGVKPDGRPEVLMYNYWAMSDQDLGDLMAYIKQAPPVDVSYPAPGVGPLYTIAAGLGIGEPVAGKIDHGAARPSTPERGVTAEYGQYLFEQCLACHSRQFPARLTAMFPTQDDFAKAMRTGVMPGGARLGAAMTTKNFAALTDDELAAMWLYAQASATK